MTPNITQLREEILRAMCNGIKLVDIPKHIESMGYNKPARHQIDDCIKYMKLKYGCKTTAQLMYYLGETGVLNNK